MPNVRRMVAVIIGVASPQRLTYLPSAVNGAHAFKDWADALGYESRLVTDEDEPVRLARLRSELEAALANPVDRMVLYFAGHGLIREAEEGLWLLSDWYAEQRAVAVEPLKRRLYRYGVKQIAIFADACRSLPAGMDAADLTPDAVLGRGPSEPEATPPIDKFIAAQDGAESYMVPGATPEEDRCLFSGMLLEGLWGTKPAAFSKVLADKITSRSLGAYLQAEVPTLAKRYKRTLNPNVSPSFPEGEDIYFGDMMPPPTPPRFPEWPPPESLVGMGAVTRAPAESEGGTTLGFMRPGLAWAETVARDMGAEPSEPLLLDQIRTQPRPDHFETGAGFAVQGGPVKAIWGRPNIAAEQAGPQDWWRLREYNISYLPNPTPLLIESQEGWFAAVIAIPQFIGALTCDRRGVSALIYREVYMQRDIAKLTEQTIAAMESGALRADAATDLAVELRQGKHADPVRGVISAYLYDAIGDIDSIRRMAFFYIQHFQPIPYDIALLAQLRGELRNGMLQVHVPEVPPREPRTEAERSFDWTYSATPPAEGPVGGLWPWMRQGWAFLDDEAPDGSTLILPGLIRLASHLMPGRFTTLDAVGGREMARLFDLHEKPDFPAGP